MRPAGGLLLSAVLAAPAAAEVTVRVVPASGAGASQVELAARAAPLAEVLDRLGRQIGMKVVYEGASPRQLVTLSLQGRSPAETVLALLEGQGLNFALVSDPTGTGVETLLVSGVAPSSGPSTSAATAATAGRSTPSTAFRRNLSPPPGSGPDTMEDSEELEEDAALDDPAASGVPVEGPGSIAPAQADPAQAPNPVPTPQAPGQQTAPSSSYPVSPFAPQATPITPQPFPPLPPGVPGGPTAPAAPQAQPETTTQPPPD